ncbi:phage shock envelope stress response protein PspM [Plantactinospora sp. CA-290183]|uniref:phage shock envelope stress response protein PspM n=1 Tax=Plantactinospora sp. CA-290183 TaxID=3240006 RepID=UPI003D8AF78B
MADLRARHLRRLSALRRSVRRWSVLAGGLGGAAAVLTPYQGLGLPDAGWTAAAGGSVVLAVWRWADLRTLRALPVPPAPEPVTTDAARARLVAAVERLPAGRQALTEVRRQRARIALRGSAAAGPWQRLDEATVTLDGLAGRLTGPAGPAVLEAAVAEHSLRDLCQRLASVERALRLAPADARAELDAAHHGLSVQLDEGVRAYERLVAAAAGYVAEDAREDHGPGAVVRLTEATELLRAVAAGLAELRTVGRPTGAST